MTLPALMSDGLVFLPQPVPLVALVVILVAGIAEFRQGYVGRPAIAANAFFLWQIFYSSWSLLPVWFQGYLDLGTVFAVIAILSYLMSESLPSEFYQLSFILYGSFSILFALIVSAQLGLPIIGKV